MKKQIHKKYKRDEINYKNNETVLYDANVQHGKLLPKTEDIIIVHYEI